MAVSKPRKSASAAKAQAPRTMTPQNALGRLFREMRIERGLDLASLASNSLVTVDNVRRLEVEPQLVPLQDLYAVANVLNLDPGDVLELLHSAMR
ncbi:hypothetical protein BH10BDE1_BH10BDE1_13480 [soil metagenome]